MKASRRRLPAGLSLLAAPAAAAVPPWPGGGNWFPLPCSGSECMRHRVQLPLLHELMQSAMRDGNDTQVQSLLSSRADLGHTRDGGDTWLMLSARFERSIIAQDLLTHGAPIDVTDANGRTALHHAVGMGSTGAVSAVLVRFHANTTLVDADGRTPLASAAAAGSLVAVRSLLMPASAAEVVNLPDTDGRTAVEHAALGGFVEITWELVKAGAAVPATVSELSARSGRPDMVALARSLVRQEIRINFQSTATEPPLGWLADYGELFETRERVLGLRYGWRCAGVKGRYYRDGLGGVLENTVVYPNSCPDDRSEHQAWSVEVEIGGYEVQVIFQDPERAVNSSGCELDSYSWDWTQRDAKSKLTEAGALQVSTAKVLVKDGVFSVSMKTPETTCTSLSRIILYKLSEAETKALSKIQSMRQTLQRRITKLQKSIRSTGIPTVDYLNEKLGRLLSSIEEIPDSDSNALRVFQDVFRSVELMTSIAKAGVLHQQAKATCKRDAAQGVIYDKSCDKCVINEEGLDYTEGGCLCSGRCDTGSKFTSFDGEGAGERLLQCVRSDMEPKTEENCLIDVENQCLGLQDRLGKMCCWVDNVTPGRSPCRSESALTPDEQISKRCGLRWEARFSGLPRCERSCDEAALDGQHLTRSSCGNCAGNGGYCECQVFCQAGYEPVGSAVEGSRTCKDREGQQNPSFDPPPQCIPIDKPKCRPSDVDETSHLDFSPSCKTCEASDLGSSCEQCMFGCVRNFKMNTDTEIVFQADPGTGSYLLRNSYCRKLPQLPGTVSCHDRKFSKACLVGGYDAAWVDEVMGRQPKDARCCWQEWREGPFVSGGRCLRITDPGLNVGGGWKVPRCSPTEYGKWSFEGECVQDCWNGYRPPKECKRSFWYTIEGQKVKVSGCTTLFGSTGSWCSEVDSFESRFTTFSPESKRCDRCWNDKVSTVSIEKDASTQFFTALSKRSAKEILISKLVEGAWPDYTNSKGQSLLMIAARNCNTIALKALIKYGAQVNLRMRNSLATALHYATMCELEASPIIELVKFGADVNAIDVMGQTPLIYGTFKDVPTNLQALLDCGADCHIKSNTNGWTAMDYAKSFRMISNVAVLRGAGCDTP